MSIPTMVLSLILVLVAFVAAAAQVLPIEIALFDVACGVVAGLLFSRRSSPFKGLGVASTGRAAEGSKSFPETKAA